MGGDQKRRRRGSAVVCAPSSAVCLSHAIPHRGLTALITLQCTRRLQRIIQHLLPLVRRNGLYCPGHKVENIAGTESSIAVLVQYVQERKTIQIHVQWFR